MPFFKISDGSLLQSQSGVYAPGYMLEPDKHADYVYPVDGWYWYDTLDEALHGLAALPKDGVPQSVPRRQAKTVMELTPHPTHGDLWQAALAAAAAIEDSAARIMTTNYLLESLYFEHPKVSELAVGLLGMTQAQVDQLFVAASKL